MKKFNLKNCIAFTLTEMTLVLLITGVIAVATTPIITSALSDSSGKGGPSIEEVADNPWRVAAKYNGGGIFNTPTYTYSATSIGFKPGASPSNYNYGALVIQSNFSDNLPNSPQIQIINQEGGSNNLVYSNIAADEYQNFAFVDGTSFYNQKVGSNGSNNTYLGSHTVYIGNGIQKTSPLTSAYYDKSIFIGDNINTAYAINTINIGSDITRDSTEFNGINIGFGLSSYSNAGSDFNSINNINIGYLTGVDSYGSYNTNLGNLAAGNSRTFRSVNVGQYAGYNVGYYSQFYANRDNVNVGYYAGFVKQNTTQNNKAVDIGNTQIGKYAGVQIFSSDQNTQSEKKYNTIMGNYTGLCDSKKCDYENNLMIGNYAGYNTLADGTLTLRNNIDIGYFSGAKIAGGYSNIMIGNYAGYNSAATGDGHILLGNFAGAQMRGNDGRYSTNIGYYAGYNSSGSYSMYMGYYAGLNSTKSLAGISKDNTPKNANVGIGFKTCQNASGGGKWCLGGGTLNTTLTYSSVTSVNVWNKDNTNNQMIIGFVDKGITGQTITLYASEVARWGFDHAEQVTNANFSDERLKTNIIPSNHSIEDIRKVNIYEFNMKDDLNKTPRIGVIAQEYQKIFPNDVTREPSTKKLTAAANWLLYSMINAIKDVDKFIQDIQNDFEVYVNDFTNLKSKIVQLENQAKQIEKDNAQMRAQLAKINKKLH